MRLTVIQVVISCYVLLICITFSSFAQEEKKDISILRVDGHGEVKVNPDVASLSISVETNAAEARTAARENAEKMDKVLARLKTQISGKDNISTSSFHIIPIYEYDESRKKSTLTGYRVTNKILIETENIRNIGKLIDSAIQAGANRLDSLRFSTDKKDLYRKQALEKAVIDAKETAGIVARAAGVSIVRVIEISPSYQMPFPIYRDARETRKMAVAQAAPTQIEPGELTISSSVNMVFEIR